MKPIFRFALFVPPMLSALVGVATLRRVDFFIPSRYTITDLGTQNERSPFINSVNSSGARVSTVNLKGSHTVRATLTDAGGSHDLGTLGGTDSVASAINERGQVTGFSSPGGHAMSHAFLYDEMGMHDLGVMGGVCSLGFGINNRGQVTGYLQTQLPFHNRAFLFDGITMRDLGTLGGEESMGFGINDLGQVTGNAGIKRYGVTHAFLYDATGMHDLGTLGGKSSYGYGINNRGQVVGTSDVPQAGTSAFLYMDGRMLDLNTQIPARSGWSLTSAYGINDAGFITGMGELRGQKRVFLLRPTQRFTMFPFRLLWIAGVMIGLGVWGLWMFRRTYSCFLR